MTDAPSDVFDLVIIGGGIQGACLARDATGRGLRTLLLEQDDLACATSSASSKLIHGGLRYLEHGEFRLVREALAEREVLMRSAPHLVRPMRFLLPHTAGSRPAWMVRIGLFLYDTLGGARTLEGAAGVRLAHSPFGRGLAPGFERGFLYSDCVTDDARLVVANALDASDHGADIRTRTACVGAHRDGEHWVVDVEDRGSAHEPGSPVDRSQVRARVLVNASGPWARQLLDDTIAAEGQGRLRLVQGTHIVVPRAIPGEHALTLQNDDGRVLFVIPYGPDHSLVGTTETPLDGAPSDAAPTELEIDYLCSSVSAFLETPFTPDDVVWSFTGVRPLYDDGRSSHSKVSREDVLELDGGDGEAPVLSIFGGKLTTARRVAERALDKLAPWFPRAGPRWTAHEPLPGGSLSPDVILRALVERTPGTDPATLRGLVSHHGGRAPCVLSENGSLGPELAPGLHAGEVRYLVEHEWARTADDVLWRRTKAGLTADLKQRAAVAEWVSRFRSQASASRRGASLESR